MKLIKVLSVLVVCFVILFNSLIIGYAADVSEPDPDEVIMYGLTHSELLEYGYIYYGDGAYGLSPGVVPIEAMMPSLLLDTAPRYPDFDPRKLPWSSAPQSVRDILYMGMDGASVSSDDFANFKVPFVCIRVNPSGVYVYVGLNCFLGYASSSGAVRICAYGKQDAQVSYCFFAKFDTSYNMVSNWSSVSSEVWGDTGNVVTYNTSTFFNDDYNADLYLYGGNGYKPGRISIATIPTTSSANVMVVQDNPLGFESGRYFYNQASFPGIYVETFSIPTPDEISQQLQEEQNSLIEYGDMLLEEQNGKLNSIDDSLDDILNASGDSELTTLPDEALSDFNEAESDLVDDYNPDNLGDDLDIDLDSSALECIWGIFDGFVTLDDSVFTLFISVMSIGIIALILGR